MRLLGTILMYRCQICLEMCVDLLLMRIAHGRHIRSEAHYKISIIPHNNTSKPTMNPSIHSSTQNSLRLRHFVRESVIVASELYLILLFSVVKIGYVCGSERCRQ